VVEAGGVGIFRGIENTQLIYFSRRQKRNIQLLCQNPSSEAFGMAHCKVSDKDMDKDMCKGRDRGSGMG
jgi:hypothetical protein